MIDWHNVSVGDPDPTDSGLPDALLCPEVYPRFRDEFFCTRAAGHAGQHVAGDGDEVVAVWS